MRTNETRQHVDEFEDFNPSHGELPHSYPLQWPPSKLRTPPDERREAKFRREGDRLTINDALDRLEPELQLMGAEDMVLSSNIRETRREYARVGTTMDPGVAVYFRLKLGNTWELHCLACDKWTRVSDNLAAIALHVAAVRGQLRWGVGDVAQAFSGHRMLAGMGAVKPWWETLGFRSKPATLTEAKARYMKVITACHPDVGGSANQAAEVNAAWELAQLELPL
jgi:hypothetical protein